MSGFKKDDDSIRVRFVTEAGATSSAANGEVTAPVAKRPKNTRTFTIEFSGGLNEVLLWVAGL